MLMKFTKRDAGAGRVLARRGPVIKRVKIPAIHISPWEAEVSLAQHQKSQQKNHPGYAVVRTKEHAKKCHKHKAEGHHKIDFKIIDENVASFLFWIGCVFDQGFGAG